MRTRIASILAILGTTSLFAADPSPDPNWIKTTHVYKTVGDLPIHADFYRHDDRATRPFVVWIHGGALILGHRESIPANLREFCQKERYPLFSLDYRLAPEVKLPDIIADIRDAFAWIRASASQEFHVDPDRFVVYGGSAGGYLTLMTGLILDPPPSALVSYYGYGDVDGDWYTQPSEHYRTTAQLVPEDQARSVVGHKVLTHTDNSNPTQKRRGEYYLFLRQNGLWTREVTGFDPVREKSKLDPFSPVRNITSKYPPTILIHGTADTDVPYHLSVDMDRTLTAQNVPHEFITVKDGNHGLSTRNTTADPAAIHDAHSRTLNFIRNHLVP